MALYQSATWITSYLLWTPALYLAYDAFSPSIHAFSGLAVVLASILSTLASKWRDQVTKHVPEPYMVCAFWLFSSLKPRSSHGSFFKEWKLKHQLGRSLSYPPSTSLLCRRFPHLGSKTHHPTRSICLNVLLWKLAPYTNMFHVCSPELQLSGAGFPLCVCWVMPCPNHQTWIEGKWKW